MSVIEVIEISSDEDDNHDASTIVDMPLGKTDDIDVQQYSDGRTTKSQSQYKDVNNPEVIDSQYLINKLINSNTKIINSLIEQNKFLSSTNGLISHADDDNLDLYANRNKNNIVDSLSHVKIVRIESLNAQENLTADIIDSHNDNDVQEIIPGSNIQNLGNGNMNEINLKNIEETTNDICHPESSNVIETSIKNEFSLFKYEDFEEISKSRHQTEMISQYSLNKLKKYLPIVRLDRTSVPENNIISLSNAENNITPSSNEENNVTSSSDAKNNTISSSNAENSITSSSYAENNYYCKECNCFFGSAKKFESHKRYRHNGRKLFNCEQCDYASNIKFNLIYHKRTHTSERPYQCFCCSFTFTYKNALKSHLFTHIDKNLSCDICHEKFTEANSLITHIIYYHSFSPSVRARQCKVCRELFPDRYSLQIHTETHKNRSLFKCHICCYTTKSLQILLIHVKKHVRQKIICNDCDKSFANKNEFLQHWYIVHKISNKSRVYKCTHCHNHRTYVRHDHFIRHVIKTHGVEYLEHYKI
ncbi:zinc finger protein 37 homolog [Microplitis mediator]|uniref:zinc finger protein 37 homolog n=1 Tax=Microplitis mediator TaxID=375433 RepID=UPI002552A240|nr:zinc finger protein 37 homolog [Microplitis mediator]